MIEPATAEAYDLLHKGTLTFAQIEANGFRVDEDKLDRTIAETSQAMDDLLVKLKEDKVFTIWKGVFKNKTKLTSRQQLAAIIYNTLGYPCLQFTEPTDDFPQGQPSTEEGALAHIEDLPFKDNWLEYIKLYVDKNTFLTGIKRELVDGYVHTFLHLAGGGYTDKGGARSYRSSSSNPNFHNFPTRDKARGKRTRSVFIPRDGHQILELDLGTMEVRIGCCYHHDPTLIDYVVSGKDMHKDKAIELFCLKEDQVTKDIRHSAKNQFVFAEFYGSYYVDCAAALWGNMLRYKLKLKDSPIFLREHLANKGIKFLGDLNPKEEPRKGSFEKHVQSVEKKLWQRDFEIYAQWKRDWWQDYLSEGGFSFHTGFVCNGIYNKNDVCNYCVQGSAFHCELWLLIRLQRWLTRHKMRSKIVNQVHDSTVIDAHPSEVQDIIQKVVRLLTVDLPKAWPWIIVPLVVEAEIAPIGGSWFDKKQVEIAA